MFNLNDNPSAPHSSPHADVTNYVIKLSFAGVPRTIESWQTTGLLSIIINQHGQSIIPMDQRWVNVLIKVSQESSQPSLSLSLSFSLSLSLSLSRPQSTSSPNRVNQPPEFEDPAILGINFGDRYSDPIDPSLGAILLHAHLSFHSFVRCSANQVEENAWTDPVRSLISAVNDQQSGSKVTAYVSPLSSRPSPSLSPRPG